MEQLIRFTAAAAFIYAHKAMKLGLQFIRKGIIKLDNGWCLGQRTQKAIYQSVAGAKMVLAELRRKADDKALKKQTFLGKS